MDRYIAVRVDDDGGRRRQIDRVREHVIVDDDYQSELDNNTL